MVYNSTMKTIAINKLDKRYTGYQYFTYSVIAVWNPNWRDAADRVATFCEMRTWCWETFGPSCELSEFMKLANREDGVNPRWCWVHKYESTPARILINSEEDKNWFVLRWG